MFPFGDISPLIAAIAALAAALFGGGGVAALYRLGPDRTGAIVGYQLKMIEGLQNANAYLAKENGRLMERVEALETRVLELELAHDDPPGHLT